jgi:hypothetical protein
MGRAGTRSYVCAVERDRWIVEESTHKYSLDDIVAAIILHQLLGKGVVYHTLLIQETRIPIVSNESLTKTVTWRLSVRAVKGPGASKEQCDRQTNDCHDRSDYEEVNISAQHYSFVCPSWPHGASACT